MTNSQNQGGGTTDKGTGSGSEEGRPSTGNASGGDPRNQGTFETVQRDKQA